MQLSEQRAEHDRELVHRERRTEAPPRAAAEREILGRAEALAQEALGQEALGFWIRIVAVVNEARREPDRDALGQPIPLEVERLREEPCDESTIG